MRWFIEIFKWISYCSRISFICSTSSWIAEHYLGASRISLHLFASVRNFVKGEYSQDIDAFVFMIQTCICSISRIKSKTEISIYEIDDNIKLLSTSFHNFEVRISVQDSNRDFSWFAKGNFLSLLNVSHTSAIIGKVVVKGRFNSSSLTWRTIGTLHHICKFN